MSIANNQTYKLTFNLHVFPLMTIAHDFAKQTNKQTHVKLTLLHVFPLMTKLQLSIANKQTNLRLIHSISAHEYCKEPFDTLPN